jgi:hypothetical protein
MRGARVAAGFLSGIALVTVGILLLHPPSSQPHMTVRIEWAWGLYASGAVALGAVVAALGFGGKLDDLPTRSRRRGDEVLH